MELVHPTTSFIIDNFKKFYYEVLREKALVLKYGSLAEEQPETSAQEMCQTIQHHLHQILEAQSLDSVRQVGEFGAAHNKESQYIMVLLADEVFLGFEWIGRKYWENNLLEARLFHTQRGGELFFQRLEALLEEKDPVKVDLSVIYLFALALGFRGQYRDATHKEILLQYRQQLFSFMSHRASDLYRGERAYLNDAPYQHNIVNEHRRGLPEVRLWLLTFTGVLVSYLFVSYALWNSSVREVSRALNSIVEQAKQTR